MKKKYLFILIPGIVVIVGVVLAVCLQNRSICTVMGHQITKQEIALYKTMYKNDVRNYYETTYGTVLTDKDWNSNKFEKSPNEYLNEIALNECIHNKIVFILANENDIIDYVDYKDFNQAFEAENKERKRALEAGEIVYGMTSFTKEQYLDHTISALKNELAMTCFAATEEEIGEYLKQHEDEWLNNVTTYYVTDSIMKNGEVADSKEYVFTADSYMTDMHSCYEARMIAERLAVGEDDCYISEEGEEHIVTLINKVVNKEAAYEEYSDRIGKLLAYTALEDHIESVYEEIR